LKIDFFILFQFFEVSWVKTNLNQETSDDWRSLNASYMFQPTSMVLRCDFNTCNAPELNLNLAIHPKNAMLGLQMLDLDFVSGFNAKINTNWFRFTLPSFYLYPKLKVGS
jgi:hypothetical protein